MPFTVNELLEKSSIGASKARRLRTVAVSVELAKWNDDNVAAYRCPSDAFRLSVAKYNVGAILRGDLFIQEVIGKSTRVAFAVEHERLSAIDGISGIDIAELHVDLSDILSGEVDRLRLHRDDLVTFHAVLQNKVAV